MIAMKSMNGWPGSLRENVANSAGDRHYLDDDTIEFFDSHMVKKVRNTGSRFQFIEKVADYSGTAHYRAVQFQFRWDSLGLRQHVSVTKTDTYNTLSEVEAVLGRGFFEE